MLDFYNYPLFAIFFVGLAIILAASEIGRRMGVRPRPHGSGSIFTLEGAVLGLLALGVRSRSRPTHAFIEVPLIHLVTLAGTSCGADACADGRTNACTPTGITGDRAAGGTARGTTQGPGCANRRTRGLASIGRTLVGSALGLGGAAHGCKSNEDRNNQAKLHKYLPSATALLSGWDITTG